MFNSNSKLRVLYVEDDVMSRAEIIFSLKKFVDEIYVAQDGEIGLELFFTHLPDLIITDIQMPKLNGFEMLKKIYETHPNIPVIITTAFNDTQYLFKTIELGISHYVQKPINLGELISKIGKITEQVNFKKRYDWQVKLLEQYKMAIDCSMTVSKNDLNNVITYCNDSLCRLSQYSSEELIGQNHSILFGMPGDENKINDILKTIMLGGIWQGTIQNKTKDKNDLILEATIFPLYDTNNNIIEYMSIGNDVSELYHYRDILEIELSLKRRSLVENIHFLGEYQNAIQKGVAVCYMSLVGDIINANQTFCDLLGYTAKEILISSLASVCKPEELSIENLIALLKEKGRHEQQIKYQAINGTYKIFNSIFIPIKDIAGSIVEIVSMHHDISEILSLNAEIISTQREVLYTLAQAAEQKSEETGSHVIRVAAYSYFIAKKYGLSEEESRMIEMVAPMHDVGKIGIPDFILHKHGKLTDDEMAIMKTHAQKGYEMFAHSNRPLMQNSAFAALYHHEKYDGSGYPFALKGDDIPIIGRIIAIADVFDSLGSDRSYKKAWKQQEILNYLIEQRGKHFDPALVDIVLGNIDEINAITEKI